MTMTMIETVTVAMAMAMTMIMIFDCDCDCGYDYDNGYGYGGRAEKRSIPCFLEYGQLLVFKLNILQTDSFSGYEQNFKQRKHFEKANPRY